jgi:hypothetical protein
MGVLRGQVGRHDANAPSRAMSLTMPLDDGPEGARGDAPVWCLAIATVCFMVVTTGLGAANYYSPMACFGQARHVRVDFGTDVASWGLSLSAMFACGLSSLVAIGLLVAVVIGLAALGASLVRCGRVAFER